MKKFTLLLTMLVIFATIVGLTACGTHQAPVYEGMSIVQSNNVSSLSASNSDDNNNNITLLSAVSKYQDQNRISRLMSTKAKSTNSFTLLSTQNDDGEFEYENDEELEEDIKDIVHIDVKGDATIKYYVKPGEVFTVQVHIDNPNSYEIQSFTLNGCKYANYMFKEGSTMELLLLDITAPANPGYFELTIDAIKYIDGTEIKDVSLDGDKTIKAGIAFTEAPTATIQDLNSGTTSVDFSVLITDNQNVINGNDIKVYLSNGIQIVAEKELKIGANNVSFPDLLMGTTYEIGIGTSYDYIDGYGVKAHWLTTEIVSTAKAFMITDATIEQTAIDFVVEKVGYIGDLTKIELFDGATNASVNTLSDTSLRSFDGLMSNHPYKIILNFVYNNAGNEICDTSIITFTTLAKIAPTVEIKNVASTQTSIGFEIATTDVDSILSIDKIELYKGNILEKTAEAVTLWEFAELLSNNEYTVKVRYSYDLNDGAGKQTKTVENSTKTLAKTAPEVEIKNMTSTQTSIGFEIATTDVDSIMSIDKIELYKGNTLVKTAEAVTLWEFVELLSNNEYTVKVSYSYDLNDGAGKQTKTVENSIKTLAKTAPTLIISNDSTTETTIMGILNISDIDEICVLNSVKVYKDANEIADNNQNKVDFSGLDYYTDYRVVVNYSFNLNDGVGIQTKEYTKEYKTSPHLAFQSCVVINTSAVSEGETIFLQANISNPNRVQFSKIVVNGIEYEIVKNTSIATFLCAEIVNNGQFAGGETALTVEKIYAELDEKTYTVEPKENNTASVFVNGKLEVEQIKIVVVKDGGYVERNYVFPSEEIYLQIKLFNKTGYQIDKVKIDSTDYTNLIKIDDDHYLLEGSRLGSWSSGWKTFDLTEIQYSRGTLEKTLAYTSMFCETMKLSSDEVRTVSTANDLSNMNTSYYYYELVNDIDLTGIEWHGNAFRGVFEGKCHSIRNMSYVGTLLNSNADLGLFSDGEGIIQNLNLESVRFIVKKGSTDGMIYTLRFGGIVAYASGTMMIENCSVDENSIIHVDGSCVGGIAGYASYAIITNCVNNGTVTGNNYVGGIAGYASYAIITNCVNNGTVTGSGENLGGIAGYASYEITNCVNNGTVTGFEYVGGIAGYAYKSTIENCVNNGIVTGNASVGGIAGLADSLPMVMNCVNNGIVTGNMGVGGIAGNVFWAIITNCVNNRTVTGNDSVGGIAGYANKSTIENCVINGAVTGNISVGGIAGYAYESIIENCYALQKNVTVAELNTKGFYTETLGWSEDVWDLTDLDIANGKYPKLK